MPNDGSHPVGQQQSPESDRSVEDARRRGWFWHWNTIITQYAPLVGLKGVGLLNSYTVWTDRREESPHHGFAFPSQQAESAFYGEDRAELITINKILVTLGLIEIRKEMVLRVDDRGRRWKVPHNLYRVRDHQDGYNLSVDDVLGVVELACDDRAVYRYVRRIFSPRFAPIDADNVWHQILPQLREQESWRKLAARAAREEARASARTKAGHAKRSKASIQPSNSDRPETTRQESDTPVDVAGETGNDSPLATLTSIDQSNEGSLAAVDVSNNGSDVVAEQSNSGSGEILPTIVEPTNEGGTRAVDQSNTTYYEGSNTTTTTTVHSQLPREEHRQGSGPMPSASPAVVSCFEAANGRDASVLEVELLAELEATFAGCAQRTGETGGEWVVAAIREAVASGSRFVAPKRLREILRRWRDESDDFRTSVAPTDEGVESSRRTAANVRLPGNRSASVAWKRTLESMSAALESDEMERLFAGSSIVGYRAGTVTVVTATAEAAERLAGEYYELLSRKLGEAMQRTVRIAFVVGRLEATEAALVEEARDGQTAGTSMDRVDEKRPMPLPAFVLSGGLSNQQIWSMALQKLSTAVGQATLETWLRPAAIIAFDDVGTLTLGVPNAFAQRRLANRLRPGIVDVLSELLGRSVELRVVVAQEWLRQQGPSAGMFDGDTASPA